MILKFGGISAISEFKSKSLLAQLKKIQPSIEKISAEYIHFVDCPEKLNTNQSKLLKSILSYGTAYTESGQGKLLLAAPRPGTISPWSSKATSIAHNLGLPVNRIERGTAYYIESRSAINTAKISAQLHDRMTETILDNLGSSDELFKSGKPRELKTVDIIGRGISELEEANTGMGLALSKEEVKYLYEAYLSINRNPTDLELMMFGVVNSEHCRHKIFNADWYIDGKKQPKSLFKMIKNTYAKNGEGVISAYSDNSAILNGHEEKMLLPNPKTKEYQTKVEKSHMVVKVETHNHPTAIAPFPGAATGSGGEIRDENATGRGSKPKMGLTGYTVSDLHIPGYTQPWEKDRIIPDRISSPLDIMIKAPLGGAAFNNEFGRPNTAGYFRTFETHGESKENWGYHKPIMIAGGVGSIRDSSKDKLKLPIGAKLIVIGGPSMLIGLAGGAASSMESGKSDSELDFASVQRGNAEIQRRAHEVISACSSLGKESPIISIHDVGAGGLSNALTELVHDSGLGAKFELRKIDSADPSLSPMEIWCNESQERYVMAVSKENLAQFEEICARERCPYAAVGETIKEQDLIINDSLFNNQPANIPMSLIFGGPPKIIKQVESTLQKSGKIKLSNIDINDALERVLRIPAVGSKKFLITIGDRNVGGLTARDQMAGPWQVPVSDCAVSATSFFGKTGEAMAMGERTPLAVINAPASARMAIGEAITNIASAKINKLSDIKLSANWMAASGYASEDYNLYQTVKAVGEEFCPELGLVIPVGKDSLSMRTVWKENGVSKSVSSPVSLIVSAFAPVSDIGSTLTPDLKPGVDSKLIFVDLSGGKIRLGGSALAQAYGQTGNESPDVSNPAILANFFDAIQQLNGKGLISAYHDRSDGGLLTTLLEMSFAGRTGIDIDLSDLAGSAVEKLFSEELGAVLQVALEKASEVEKILYRSLGDVFYSIGKVNGRNKITIFNSGEALVDRKRSDLEKIWAETSYQIQKIRDNEESASQEFAAIEDDTDPGISPVVTYKSSSKSYTNRPKVAILREQGVNGQTEMAAAFDLAGFSAVDVHMQDLISKKAILSDFTGLVACGGFSYGDVLGAGMGWAKSILYDSRLKAEFSKFFERKDTFSLGVCNGCQMLAGLRGIIPGAENWPEFLKNKSEQFEARFVSVKINKSSSIFLKDMEGSVLPIAVAHGEGRAVFKNKDIRGKLLADNTVPLQFVDNRHDTTEIYPLNPNGSELGIAALSSGDGRALIMMPHPERTFMTYQNSWHPDGWSGTSPWFKMFQNAREWAG